MAEPPVVARVTPRDRAVDQPSLAVGARFSGLEAYRGIAALGIVVYHVFQYVDNNNPGAFTNPRAPLYLLLHSLDALVALFFVLSAFLLSLPYVRSALHGEQTPSARAFVFRRATRIVPLYLIAILLVWSLRNPGVPGSWIDLLEHLTFTQVFDSQRIFYTIGPAWSLAVEVQFYVLLALGGWVTVEATRRMRMAARLPFLVSVTVAGGLASLAWKFFAAHVLHVGGDDWSVWFGLPAKFDEFALGILLAIVVASGRLRWGPTTVIAARIVGFGVLVLAAITRPVGVTTNVAFHTIAAVGFTLILASSVLGPQDRWVRAMSARTFAFLGLISYSLYLWHEPLLTLLTRTGWFPAPDAPHAFVLGVALLLPPAIVLAWLSYEIIESPAGKLRMLVTRDGKRRDYYNGD